MEISKRLATVAQYVAEGSTVADIGTDHALLPIHLIKSGKSLKVTAGEVNIRPLEIAKRNVRDAGLEDVIDLCHGDGLSIIKEGEVDTVCISGMGGTLITSILDSGLKRLPSIKRVILQPNVASKNVRKWLYEHNWELEAETILEDEGVIYEVLTAIPGNPHTPYLSDEWSREQWFELGPFLWDDKSSLFKEKWLREYRNMKHVLEALKHAKENLNITAKQKYISGRLNWIEEVLSCI